MARPKKSALEKRTKIVKVRYSASEFTQISDAAVEAGLTVSDHIRGITVNAEPLKKPVSPSRQLNLKGLAELSRVGVNLNQLQREVNTHNKYPEYGKIDAELINDALLHVKTLTHFLINELENGH